MSAYVTYDLFNKQWLIVPQNAGSSPQAVVNFTPNLAVAAGTIVRTAYSNVGVLLTST